MTPTINKVVRRAGAPNDLIWLTDEIFGSAALIVGRAKAVPVGEFRGGQTDFDAATNCARCAILHCSVHMRAGLSIIEAGRRRSGEQVSACRTIQPDLAALES